MNTNKTTCGAYESPKTLIYSMQTEGVICLSTNDNEIDEALYEEFDF